MQFKKKKKKMTTKFKDLLKSRLEPTDAIIFYKPTVKVGEKEGAFVEYRPIEEGNLGAGQPLEVDTLTKMMRTVSKYVARNTTLVSMHGIVPPNLIYTNTSMESHKLVWWRKPEKRMMYFSKSLGIPDGEIEIPGIVYMAAGRRLSVFAFKGNKPKDTLYQGPFFNVYNDGSVCLGSARVPKPKDNTFENWMEYWEKMFWMSEFAAIIEGNPIKKNLALVTKECIENKKPFPTSTLIKSSKTLNSLFV